MPCQEGDATHVHRQSSLLARPYSAGRCVREEPWHTYTGLSSLPARPHLAGRRVREETQHRYTCCQPNWPLIKILQAHLSWCNLHPRHYKSPQLYPERNDQRKRIVRQTKEFSTMTGAAYYGYFCHRCLFLHWRRIWLIRLFSSPSVAGDRDVVCDPPLYGTGSVFILGLTSRSYLHWLLTRIQKVIVGELNLTFSTPLIWALFWYVR